MNIRKIGLLILMISAIGNSKASEMDIGSEEELKKVGDIGWHEHSDDTEIMLSFIGNLSSTKTTLASGIPGYDIGVGEAQIGLTNYKEDEKPYIISLDRAKRIWDKIDRVCSSGIHPQAFSKDWYLYMISDSFSKGGGLLPFDKLVEMSSKNNQEIIKEMAKNDYFIQQNPNAVWAEGLEFYSKNFIKRKREEAKLIVDYLIKNFAVEEREEVLQEAYKKLMTNRKQLKQAIKMQNSEKIYKALTLPFYPILGRGLYPLSEESDPSKDICFLGSMFHFPRPTNKPELLIFPQSK